MGSSFECDGDARELTLVKVFPPDFWGTRPYIWVYCTLAMLFIFCNKGLYPEIISICLYSNYTGGGDLDLIDFQQPILTHRQIYCTYIIILLWSVTGRILDWVGYILSLAI